MKNLEIAKIFYEIADILEMKNIQWKPRAYRKAAKAIENLSEDVEEIYKKQNLKGLQEIPGVGEALAKKIVQFIETGKIKEHERLKKLIPKHLSELIEIPALGPKRAEFLHKKLGIKNIRDLERAIKQHKIAKLATFGEKSEENILKGIQIFKGGQERTLLGIALPIAKDIENKLKKLKQIGKVIAAGSVRRRKETIRDIDLLVTAKNTKLVMDFFTTMPSVGRVMAKGHTKSTVILKNGLQVDIRVVPDKSFGSALNYFTGSKEHNIRLREMAIKKNYKLSEYGLFSRKTNKFVAGRTEAEVYKKLGLRYIEPELRENQGEIEASLKGKLPKLIELKDIKGDLHVHSKYSDGANTIEEIAKAAKALGYKYICIADHSKGIRIAHGLIGQTLKKQIKEIDKLNKKFKDFKILKGIEVNIKQDGSLDYSDKVLKKLDVVTASIHSGFKLDREKMTQRIIKAMQNENVDIIGHPTGRLINKRGSYELDFKKIFTEAKKTNTVLEINATPERFDLKDLHIKSAIENKVKLVINTDAHSINGLKFMELGIMQARRGWATKKSIVNCLSLAELKKVLKH